MPSPDERQPSWWLDPPDEPDPDTDLQAEAEQREIDRYLDSLD